MFYSKATCQVCLCFSIFLNLFHYVEPFGQFQFNVYVIFIQKLYDQFFQKIIYRSRRCLFCIVENVQLLHVFIIDLEIVTVGIWDPFEIRVMPLFNNSTLPICKSLSLTFSDIVDILKHAIHLIREYIRHTSPNFISALYGFGKFRARFLQIQSHRTTYLMVIQSISIFVCCVPKCRER